MFWNKYFIPSVMVMLVVVFFHWLGSLNDLYFFIKWYDYPMHFLGGAWVALFILWSISTQYGTIFKKHLTIRNIIITTFVVGVAWEILELALQFNDLHDIGYTWDTTHDLIMDVLGASTVCCIYKKALQSNL